MTLKQWIVSILFVTLSLITFKAFAYDRVTQRSAFLAALSDLQRGNQPQFITIADHLRDYPLYPYLLYSDLVLHLPQVSSNDIQGFLTAYKNTPLASHLRNLWLAQLAQEQQWPQFLSVYLPSKDVNLQCYQREALWQTGNVQAATQDLTMFLNKNRSLPMPCLYVFGQALRSGNVAEDLLLQRIQEAWQSNDIIFASQLGALLPATDKPLFTLWQNIYQSPQLILQPGLFNLTQKFTTQIIITALQRIADKNPVVAVLVWQRLRARYQFSVDTQEQILRVLAIALAQAHDPNAEAWLMAIAPNYLTDTISEWRIRSSMYNADWLAVQHNILALPTEQQQKSEWRYWLARALASQGQLINANNIYRDLSLHGDYYGQLASLQLHQQPLTALKTLAVSRDQIIAIAELPAIQRSYELYQLQWLPEAHQEWQWAIDHIPEEDYLAAAELAASWGWFEQAIATVNLINDGSNIALRFPLAYRDNILQAASSQQLDPAWEFALIRQESLFTANARSGAGALGLMQLLPSTAALIANKYHIGFTPDSLFNAEINLTIGSVYLRRMTTLFTGNMVLATAAYNAGPAHVEKWLPKSSIPADVWIENIPFHETRDYVKNIMASTTYYEKELGIPSTLAYRMQNL
jgi:soluble lytic murein transglycosylase